MALSYQTCPQLRSENAEEDPIVHGGPLSSRVYQPDRAPRDHRRKVHRFGPRSVHREAGRGHVGLATGESLVVKVRTCWNFDRFVGYLSNIPTIPFHVLLGIGAPQTRSAGETYLTVKPNCWK